MRIWHLGASSLSSTVNGVDAVLWMTARAQAARGHAVHVLLAEQDVDGAAASRPLRPLPEGLTVHALPGHRLGFARADVEALLVRHPPDLVHFHSLFVPRQTRLGHLLHRRGVPYVLTPHGGMLPPILQRGRLKKRLYTALFERRYARQAAGITVVTPGEREAVEAFVGGVHGPIVHVTNPVDPTVLEAAHPAPAAAPARVVFLGRFDVAHKGLDRLVAMARRLPDVQFDLYGRSETRTAARFEALRRTAPANVAFHPPVFGDDKRAVLETATLYLQPSHWEVFGISIAEALYAGVPCALPRSLHLARELDGEDVALLLPEAPAAAAEALGAALKDAARLARWARRGRAYARTRFVPGAVAEGYLRCYEHVLHTAPTPALASP